MLCLFRHVGHCRACRDLDNQARARQDWTTYRVMLKNLRHTEEGQRDQSHIIFLMQEADLRYLVENIWGGQSALSANKDLYELRMVRWHPKLPWAPWNCVLLTQDEAASHSKLEDMGAVSPPGGWPESPIRAGSPPGGSPESPLLEGVHLGGGQRVQLEPPGGVARESI